MENEIMNENRIIYITFQDSIHKVYNAHMNSNTWTNVKFRELKLKFMSWFIYVYFDTKDKIELSSQG